MKYLNSYKLFEEIHLTSKSPIMQTLSDILIDLEDEGFIIDLNGLWDRKPDPDYLIKDSDPNGKAIFVTIWKDEFNYNEISKSLEHMFTYLEGEGYYVSKTTYGFEHGATNEQFYSIVGAGKESYDPKRCLSNLNGLDFTRNLKFEFNLSGSDKHTLPRRI